MSPSNLVFLPLSPAGVHFTAVGSVCLRCFLRIYYTLLYKGKMSLSCREVRGSFRFGSDPPPFFCSQSGESIMVEVAAGPSDSATHEKVIPPTQKKILFSLEKQTPTLSLCLQLPMVLKVPRLNSSPLALCDRPFSLLGFGDVLVPGGGFIYEVLF